MSLHQDVHLAKQDKQDTGCGGDIPALVWAIREREAQRRDLLQRQQRRPSDVALNPDSALVDLRERLADWRSLLRDEAPRARGLLKQLTSAAWT